MKRVFFCLTAICFVLVSILAFSARTAKASGGFVNDLLGVAAIDRDNVWAVGETDATTHSQTLIEHLHNHTWQIVSSPNPANAIVANLSGVAAHSANDVWAVGSYSLLNQTSQTLIKHWNGTQWQIVASPNLSGSNGLNAVTALSASNAWAVGSLIEHWNGKAWQIVPGPQGAPSSIQLTSVTYITQNDVWAVGYLADSNLVNQGIIEHWNGHVWRLISNPAPTNSLLQSVTASSSKDVWAVGYSRDSNGIESTLTEHWNGQAWKVIASPPNPAHSTILRLTGVSAVSQNDVWAVGFYRNTSGTERTLTEHWNGKTWQTIVSPSDSASSELNAIATISHESAWAVGAIFPTSSSLTLAEYWNGLFWGIVYTPTV